MSLFLNSMAFGNFNVIFPDSPDGLDNSLFSQLTDEMDSVALEWKTLRNVYECICSTPFDHFSRKVKHPFYNFKYEVFNLKIVQFHLALLVNYAQLIVCNFL